MADVFRARARGIDSRDRFIGEIGLVFESMHLPRIAGQIFGALLLAPARGYTATDLVDMLQVSKGSVSGMTRLLMHYEMVSRISLPGDRRDRFAIKPGASAEMLLGRMAQLGQLQALAHEGLELLGPDGDPGPLMEVRDMYAFLQRELPLLIDRWEEQRTDSVQTSSTGPGATAVAGKRANP
jgi:hypothetical protein